MIPIVAHIPHSSAHIPPDLRGLFKLSDAELQRELLRLTDWYVDELFSSVEELGGAVVMYHVSRLVDPERFEDDAHEVMASRGMGVIYTQTSDGRGLRATPSALERQVLLDRFYRPHHKAMEDAVVSCLETYGKCLILDCHSFPSTPLPFELDQDPVRPDICLGVDSFHTPSALTNSIEHFFHTLGWTVCRDKPYKGTLVPTKFYGRDRRASSIMIEANRKLYMDEGTCEKLTFFTEIQGVIGRFVNQVIHMGLLL